MNLFKKLCLMLGVVVFLFASESDLVERVKNNPELLNTPQGELVLRQYGLTKDAVLKMTKKEKVEEKKVEEKIKNEITFQEQKSEDINKTRVTE